MAHDARTLTEDGEHTVLAAAELVQRTGGTRFSVGYLREGVPSDQAGWYAEAMYQGNRVVADEHPGPAEAAEALARRVASGALCTCRRLVMIDGDEGAPFAGDANTPARFLDGTTLTEDEAARAGLCTWTREGPLWYRSCQERPAPPWEGLPEDELTSHRLAVALGGAGAPAWLVARAREGWYDDYRGVSAAPLMELVGDLRRPDVRLDGFAQRVIDGEFDATAVEGAAWQRSPEGQQAFADLTARRPGRAPRGDTMMRVRVPSAGAWSTPAPGARPAGRRKRRR